MLLQQEPVSVNNVFDKHALMYGIERLPGESNAELLTRIINTGKYVENTSRQGFINALCNLFGAQHYNTINRRVYYMTHVPVSMVSVTVNGVQQNELSAYDEGASGYYVWRDHSGEYTNVLEFMQPPPMSRRSDGLHNGSVIVIRYVYNNNGTLMGYVDRSNPYDEHDDEFLGLAVESIPAGSPQVIELFDDAALIAAGLMNSNRKLTDQLLYIYHAVDAMLPITWGE